MMADCNAMNVSGASAAIFFYTDYPLCRISSGYELDCWKTDLQGCRTFSISDRTVLFSAQYDDQPGTAYLGTLEGDSLSNVTKLKLCLPNRPDLPEGEFIGRGSRMYFFDAAAVHSVDIVSL